MPFPRAVAAHRPLFLLYTDAEKECVGQITRARDGAPIDAVHFAANTHAFDEEDQAPGSEFTYDREATQRSLALLQQFVATQVDRLK